MNGMRLTRAMIFVNNLDRMTDFYRSTIGLKPIEDTRLENYIEFDAGAARFALHAIPAAVRCEPTSPLRLRENAPVKLSFEVDDIAAERKRLESLGVMIIDRPWGSWEAADPEGNIFGIYSSSG
jgi:catechol 2,3-dioxygenase-like lactoylglutathione lyase family enzyme